MRTNENQTEAGGLRISVVVPVRNEERSITKLLDALLGQTRPPDEIVITDGGSTDATVRMIESYVGRDTPVRLIRTAAALPGRGRNLAASAATCEWLAFIDAGAHPDKNWLDQLARGVERDRAADVVYGGYEPVTDSLFTECAALAYVPPAVELSGALIRPRSIISALMRRDVWRAVGGFPEHLRSAEDLLFMEKVDQAKFRSVYEPHALVYWDLQPSFWRTFKRFTTYSRNNIRAGLWRRWQAPVMFRYAALLLLASLAVMLGRWWLLPVTGLWLLLLVARAIVALRRNRSHLRGGLGRDALRLPVLVSLIATLDAATIIGGIDWILKDKLHLGNRPVGIGHT
ncbi:MAG TPA: glycosyltransferase [Pyrinomonadaceae bacterium]